MKKYVVVLSVLFCIGCSGIDTSIKEYNAVASKIELGYPKDKVLSILMPTQRHMSVGKKKAAEQYIKDDVKVEIFYFRSLRQPDGLTTDDEFTPYVFNDGKLVAIGWTAIGGPKTQGQATSHTYMNVQQSQVVY